jgi:hypothetical protein
MYDLPETTSMPTTGSVIATAKTSLAVTKEIESSLVDISTVQMHLHKAIAVSFNTRTHGKTMDLKDPVRDFFFFKSDYSVPAGFSDNSHDSNNRL